MPKIHVMPTEYVGARVSTGAQPEMRSQRRIIIVLGGVFLVVVGGAAWYFTAPLRTPPTAVSVAPVGATPIETPAPTPTPEPAVTPPLEVILPVVEAPLPSVDSDNDGLTNAEEEALGTEANNPDSDNDGFLDGHETLNLYNPGGFQPERLLDAGLVREYIDTPQQVSFYYPKTWNVSAADETGQALTVSAPSGETMGVSIIRNPKDQTVEAWYAEQNGGVAPDSIALTTKAGVKGIMVKDNRSLFFAHGKTIVALRYNTGTTDTAALLYPHIFEMIGISLVFWGA